MVMKRLLHTTAAIASCALGCIAQEASYTPPTALRYLGTITESNPLPAANLVTTNPINDGACLWIPAGTTVKYANTSSGAPVSWIWSTDGGQIEDDTQYDARIKYAEPGTYNFPTLSVNYADGTSEAKPDWKIKVGGRAELCLADCREWLTTYGLGSQYYDQTQGAAKGCLGGTNSLDIAGVGNLYMTALEEGFLDGVNIYLSHKPTRWKEGAKIRVRIWIPQLGDNDILFTGTPIDGYYVRFEDIKSDQDAWVPVNDGAVLQITLDQPIDLYGKQLLFIDVDGWSYDPATEDFHMLMDVMPNKIMEPENASDKLAHNSFVRLKGENDYLRPVSYYGGGYGSFMICPVVRGGETPYGGVESVKVDRHTALDCSVNNGTVTLTGDDDTFTVYSATGILCHTGAVDNGSYTFSIAGFAPGIYIVRTTAGLAAKFLNK